MFGAIYYKAAQKCAEHQHLHVTTKQEDDDPRYEGRDAGRPALAWEAAAGGTLGWRRGRREGRGADADADTGGHADMC